jgi:cytochrome c peroxidase
MLPATASTTRACADARRRRDGGDARARGCPDPRRRDAALALPRGLRRRARDDDDAVFADVGRLLAAYQATLRSARTPFDAWRDALAAGARDRRGPAPRRRCAACACSSARAGCIACHSGAAFGDDALHVSTIHSLRADGTPDTGHAGTLSNAFRTPSLREVAFTAPYMHDGSIARLCDAVRPHALPDSTVAANPAPP